MRLKRIKSGCLVLLLVIAGLGSSLARQNIVRAEGENADIVDGEWIEEACEIDKMLSEEKVISESYDSDSANQENEEGIRGEADDAVGETVDRFGRYRIDLRKKSHFYEPLLVTPDDILELKVYADAWLEDEEPDEYVTVQIEELGEIPLTWNEALDCFETEIQLSDYEWQDNQTITVEKIIVCDELGRQREEDIEAVHELICYKSIEDVIRDVQCTQDEGMLRATFSTTHPVTVTQIETDVILIDEWLWEMAYDEVTEVYVYEGILNKDLLNAVEKKTTELNDISAMLNLEDMAGNKGGLLLEWKLAYQVDIKESREAADCSGGIEDADAAVNYGGMTEAADKKDRGKNLSSLRSGDETSNRVKKADANKSDEKILPYLNDYTAPNIIIDSLSSLLYNQAKQIHITISDEYLDPVNTCLTVNGEVQEPLIRMAGGYTKALDYTIVLETDGIYHIQGNGQDLAGNKTDLGSGITIIIDTTAPEVRAVEIEREKGLFVQPGLKISDYLEIEENNLVRVLCTIANDEGYFEWDISQPLETEGKNVICLSLLDVAGNVSDVMTFEIYIDYTPPEVVVKDVMSGSTLSADEVNTFDNSIDLWIELFSYHEEGVSEQDKMTSLFLMREDAVIYDFMSEEGARDIYKYRIEDTGSYQLVLEACDTAGNTTGTRRYFIEVETLNNKTVEHETWMKVIAGLIPGVILSGGKMMIRRIV